MRCLVVVLFLLFSLWTHAQKTISVTASYTYYAPENVSLEDAKQTSLERAKIQCIADHFGTVVSQSTSTVVSNQNGQSETSMFSMGGSELKGEWVETTQDPLYDVQFQQGMLVVKVTVKGKIKEIVQKDYNLSIKVLRNGTDAKNEQYVFLDGDDMFLSFSSPMNGFLAVYLLDAANKTAYCLLPYRNSPVGSWPIIRDHEYLFFSAKTDKDADEYTMTCTGEKEFYQMVLLFSTHNFVKAQTMDADAQMPRELSYPDFIKWVAKMRNKDNELSVVRKEITIKKK